MTHETATWIACFTAFILNDFEMADSGVFQRLRLKTNSSQAPKSLYKILIYHVNE